MRGVVTEQLWLQRVQVLWGLGVPGTAIFSGTERTLWPGHWCLWQVPWWNEQKQARLV